ncbi:Leucine-rich repeat protein [Handroanthus impetiginosus]|uniref:Leucine-rich repeat protein n=1 Tax=Handroanthus impetiginosus TaxID=429701 RepID=A0A2G9GGF5_9LAMI|nr:Leucine-rich repeat protein [Handroanthus impetiginosus]
MDWVSNLHSLEYLDLSYTNLSKATNWLQAITKLASIEELHLECSSLQEIPPSLLPSINGSTHLAILDLSFNWYLTSPLTVLRWFSNFSSLLTSIDFKGNRMQGPIPDVFETMVSLKHLDLLGAAVQGNNIIGTFSNISRFSSLRELKLRKNQLNGTIKEGYVKLPHLLVLDLSSNQLTGPVLDLSFSQSLKQLLLDNNMFNEILPQSIGCLSKLEVLWISSNLLEDLTEAHMFNLSHLQILDLSLNSFLTVKFSPEWVPPFQLEYLSLKGCKLGPEFPLCLKTQTEIVYIDISNAGILDIVPSWFGSIASLLLYMNTSNNQMYGGFPNLSFSTTISFKGSSLPHFRPTGIVLDLSRNKISGSITLLCHSKEWELIDLSDNQLSDQIPNCFANFGKLEYLNLANNHFSGTIPHSFGSLSALSLLHLRNNNFSGRLPLSMRNCTKLMMIDLGENKLTRKIPAWTGNSFPQLISGAIPKCVDDYIAMTQNHNYWDVGGFTLHDFPIEDRTYSLITSSFERNEVKYIKHLDLVKLIDLSSNNLAGEIPFETTKLLNLVGLNFSRNNLTGSIPPSIGQSKELNFLDFSRNHLSGSTPTSLSDLSHLGVLDLSYNNFSGRIPQSNNAVTFDESDYLGNSNLCGKPLNKSCPGDEAYQNPNSNSDVNNAKNKGEPKDDRIITEGFYIAMGLGFIVGFWGIFGLVMLNKEFRYVLFKGFDSLTDLMYLRMELGKACLLRQFQNQLALIKLPIMNVQSPLRSVHDKRENENITEKEKIKQSRRLD